MKYLPLVFLLFSLVACDEGATSSAATDPADDKPGGVAELIRNPVSADAADVDTSKVARLAFAESTFEFGTVDVGAIIDHEFSFTNEGSVPLIISDVRSTCGCTVAEWPREPIAPGAGGVIPVRFDTKNKQGLQNKPVTITANTFPAKTVIYLNGRVETEE